MVFDFLKKKLGGESTPDVGKEEEFDLEAAGKSSKKKVKEPEKEEESDENQEETEEKIPENRRGGKGLKKIITADESSRFEFERINARLDSFSELLKGYGERFSKLSEQIGEVRTMALVNEKSIAKGTQEAAQVIDMFKEVKPEKLRIEYQKSDLKINEVDEKVESTKQLMETIMNEIKDIRMKAGIFVGTEALLKLNEDIKKDLIEVQRTANQVRVNADKSEQIFIELRRGFAETQKKNELIDNINVSQAEIKKELEKLRLEHTDIVSQEDFEDFKKTFNNKFMIFTNALADVEKSKEETEKLSQLIETSLSISKRNEEDIADIAITIGNDHIKKVADYENQLNAILGIIDTLAGQVNEIRKKIGMPAEKKIMIDKTNRQIIQEDKIKMNNMNIHPEIAKGLIVKKEEVPNTIKKIKPKKAVKIKNDMKKDKEAGATLGDEIIKGAKDFVRKARMRGYSDKIIFSEFQKKGWKKDLIEYFLKSS